MKKSIAVLFSAAALAAMMAFPALAGEWRTGGSANDTRWWYDNGDGTWAENGWKWIDGNGDGVAECYYFDADGWLLVNTVTPDQYTVSKDGEWIENGVVQIRLVAETPSQNVDLPVTGWQKEGEALLYYKNGQYLTSQWYKVGSKKYYFDDDGYAVTGFQEIDGDEYYFNSDGSLQTSSFTLDDVYYTVDSDGVIINEADYSDEETSQYNDSGWSLLMGHQDDYAEEVFELVNEERQKKGRNELDWNSELAYAASVRAEELVEKYSHTRPDGTECFTILEDEGIWFSSAGENIAMGYMSPASVMNGWMNSTGHRENILSKGYDEIGVGCYAEDGTLYWVQMFIGN